ncbi:metallophosphoesterase [Candidatus Pacearchaeota archaeon]|nr:metallophosphoesterase [Candidatus Pacearchaeota archaeon]
MSQKILKLFIEKGFLLDSEILKFLDELDDENIAYEILNKIALISKRKIITKGLVYENLDKIKPFLFELDSEKKKLVDKYFVDVSISLEFRKERVIEDISENLEEKGEKVVVKVLSSPVIASKKLEVRDFVKYFRNRYNLLRKILYDRPELTNLISIDKVSGNRDFSIIGIVTKKQITKNKNIILEIEDLTGKVKLLINQNKEEVFNKAKEILLDDVIGFRCNGSKDFLFVQDLFYPDSFLKYKKMSKRESYALFISDIHVGSKNFLENNFNRFIDWLNGIGCSEKEKGILSKISYLFVVGDTVEGVGIYPGQEKELIIKDIIKQYESLTAFYSRIPKHIHIIQCAGQHDAVRIAEPQPPVGEDFAKSLHTLKNIHLVSNPSFIEIETGYCSINGANCKDGIKVLMYHGASMHNMINEIEELRLSNAHATPTKVIKHILLRRHLAPTHGETTYIPDHEEDSMLIKDVPDIITTGDLHRTDIDSYNNVLIIANSCWQSRTAFEEKVGNIPDPCKVPLLNLHTRAIKILDFSDEE